MHIRSFAAALCLAALAALPARAGAQVVPAEDHVVELGVMLWKPSPGLVLSTATLTGAGVENVDFVREFAIEDTAFPEFRGAIGRNHKVRVSYVSIQYDEETTLERTIVFRGRTFEVNVPATADITWDLWRIGYEWDFVSRERGFLGFIAELKHNRVQAAIDSPALTSAATTDTTAPVPTIGVIGRAYPVPALSITGEFTGFSFEREEEFDVSFWDFDLYATASFGRHVGIQGGYRSVVADYLVDEDSGNLKLRGPYFGALVRF